MPNGICDGLETPSIPSQFVDGSSVTGGRSGLSVTTAFSQVQPAREFKAWNAQSKSSWCLNCSTCKTSSRCWRLGALLLFLWLSCRIFGREILPFLNGLQSIPILSRLQISSSFSSLLWKQAMVGLLISSHKRHQTPQMIPDESQPEGSS